MSIDEDFDGFDYTPTPTVILSCSGDRVDSANVEFLDVNEDISGRDVMTFVCPQCGEEHNSLIFG